MLSHEAVAATVRSLAAFGAAHGVPFSPADSILSYLPLAHIFGRWAEASLLYRNSPACRAPSRSVRPAHSRRGGARFRSFPTPDRDSLSAPLSRAHRPPPLCPRHPPRSATEELVLYAGGSIGFWRGDIKGLVEDIDALKPTLFAGVPRVYDRIYAGVVAKVRADFEFHLFYFIIIYLLFVSYFVKQS